MWIFVALPLGVIAVFMYFYPSRERYWRDNEDQEAEEGRAYTEPHNLRS